MSEFLLRWLHYLAGITWIGLLYYFNFVQGPFFAEADAATKSAATQKLVPRALWWFRWAALFTFLTGVAIVGMRFAAATDHAALMSHPWTVTILTGGLFGTLMLLNVWLVIWPKQKIVIASAVAAAGGGSANPAAPAAARRAFLASRTNVVFSFPMLLFMGAATHMPPTAVTNPMGYWLGVLALVLVLEVNALAATTGPTTKPIEKIPGAITTGFVVAAIAYALVRWCLSA
ncbi:MAG: urate hydroxylase PuuD [Gemmatimonadales bacterium]